MRCRSVLYRRPVWPTLLLVLLSLGLSQCNRSLPPLTQATCEADGDYVWVTAGEFIAGSDRNERDYAYRISAEAMADQAIDIPAVEQQLRQQRWFDFEPQPSTPVIEADFCLARHPVTNAEYQVFIQATGHRQPEISPADYQAQGFLVHPYTKVQAFLWQENQHPVGQADHPVVLISIADIKAYTQWKHQQDRRSYRLPTALEWEKAARGSSGQYFPWGNQWRDEATNWAHRGGLSTSAVGAYPLSRSPSGAEDMAGNVFEYTATQTQRKGEPASVMKGCSWDDLPGFCRAAYRHARPVRSRHILFGFRLIKE